MYLYFIMCIYLDFLKGFVNFWFLVFGFVIFSMYQLNYKWDKFSGFNFVFFKVLIDKYSKYIQLKIIWWFFKNL